ncbi:MerR family transcriptional regulator [Rhodococcoides fascians]|uniref:MerR family transcriptional regulator n=1 Tax=Rhodococcoides fascians TaxID=1828 RepID=UPI00050CFDDE|nr:MerR family transcriptional regulator [Rhodococcus fascians]AMY55415.1 hypothetical protein A3L23_04107 [Rhodococcus fascians D188]
MRPTDLARRHGLSTQAVRNYEEVGVLPLAVRSDSGYRCYTLMHAAALDAFVALRRGHGYRPAVDIMRAVNARDDDFAYRTIDADHAALHSERGTYGETAAALKSLSTMAPRPIDGRPLTVGELARRLDLHPATLRAWEAEGVVQPTRAPTTGYREYAADAVRDVEIARQLRRGGYRLSQVAHFLESLRGAGGVDELRSFLDAWQARLSARGRDLLVGAARLDAYLRLRDRDSSSVG